MVGIASRLEVALIAQRCSCSSLIPLGRSVLPQLGGTRTAVCSLCPYHPLKHSVPEIKLTRTTLFQVENGVFGEEKCICVCFVGVWNDSIT